MTDKQLIPGRVKYDWREVMYLEVPSGTDFESDLFNKVISAHRPLIPKEGGVVSQNFVITTPDDTTYYCLSYNKDIEGWRQQIMLGAGILGLRIGIIKDEDLFITSKDEVYELEECRFEKYNFYDENRELIKERTLIDKIILFGKSEI
ncbi:hypothetical protein [Prevotella sp. 10(H)]|uniref:hypothetical protein n=1 Tax=Prevotella sp. 10(H) TaxID=1158294 RepID=UPI00068EC2C2|nr:hypothetical protein [Prevotella sp. 10(H)]